MFLVASSLKRFEILRLRLPTPQLIVIGNGLRETLAGKHA
jgi:hypothetical protein